METKLTGRFYHKKTLFGLILMVEEVTNYSISEHSPDVKRVYWRKAKEYDLIELNNKSV